MVSIDDYFRIYFFWWIMKKKWLEKYGNRHILLGIGFYYIVQCFWVIDSNFYYKKHQSLTSGYGQYHTGAYTFFFYFIFIFTHFFPLEIIQSKCCRGNFPVEQVVPKNPGKNLYIFSSNYPLDKSNVNFPFRKIQLPQRYGDQV